MQLSDIILQTLTKLIHKVIEQLYTELQNKDFIIQECWDCYQSLLEIRTIIKYHQIESQIHN